MVSVLDLFTAEQLAAFTRDSRGNLKGPCPSCGPDRDGYGGFVIFVDSNTCYCAGSKTIFNMMELVALLNGVISCREGRQKI